ncbi:hypothetical protein ACWDD9_34640 [Kitasatospora sp. NPDC001119]
MNATIEYVAAQAGAMKAAVAPATALVRHMIGDADAFGLARSQWNTVVYLTAGGQSQHPGPAAPIRSACDPPPRSRPAESGRRPHGGQADPSGRIRSRNPRTPNC